VSVKGALVAPFAFSPLGTFDGEPFAPSGAFRGDVGLSGGRPAG